MKHIAFYLIFAIYSATDINPIRVNWLTNNDYAPHFGFLLPFGVRGKPHFFVPFSQMTFFKTPSSMPQMNILGSIVRILMFILFPADCS